MSYEIFSIVDASHDDDAIYPTLSGTDAVYPIETDRDDGRTAHVQVSRAWIGEPTANGGLAKTVNLPTDIKWDLLITDCRLIIYSVKYDKGGGWSGWGTGALIAAGANAVSKARAAHRRKGKVLVGQIRYPWLERLAGSPKEGWRGSEALRFKVDAQAGGPGHRPMYLDLYLPKQLDAVAIAHEIATRAARYRLGKDVHERHEKRAEFEALAASPRRPAERAKAGQPSWAWYVLPTSYRVNSRTARLEPKEPDSADA